MINVMVIEDRILTLNALKTQICWEQEDLNPVGFYTNCQEAIKDLDRLKPDVIISDIVMPGMDGLSFCEYINGLGRNIKIIIISAYSKFEYAKKGIQLGVYDFLEKPVDYDLLSKRIAQAGKDKYHEEQVMNIYENNHGIYQESVFQKLLRDNEESRRYDTAKLSEVLGTDLEKMQFNCIMITAETERGSEEKEVIGARICKKLSEYYQNQDFWGPFFMERDMYCIIFGERVNFLIRTLAGILEQCVESVTKENADVCLNIGVGYWVDDIRKLQQSANAARQALEYRFVFGKNQVFCISDYADKELSDYTSFDYFESQLADSIGCGDFDRIDRVCAEIMGYMKTHHIEKSYLLYFVTDFLSTQISALLPEEKLKKLVNLDELGKLEYTSDILSYFKNILQITCQEARNYIAKDTDTTVKKIKGYVEQNFMQENLSLGQIAEEFHMSPNYICRIFKEKTGNTLTQYIQNLKITHAKKLLVKSDRKIGEISSMLGYSSQYYFSVGFKKITGYSPKEYRRMQK